MSTRISNAIVARCLLDVGFLDAIKGQRKHRQVSSREVRETLQTLDLVRLKEFAGFITKVRHNHLWEELPYTRQLILRYQIETQVFTEYCPVFQASVRGTELTREDKTRLFIEHLQKFLAVGRRRAAYPALYDILIHESILLQMQSANVDLGADQAIGEVEDVDFEKVDTDTRLWIPGFVRCASFEYSPQQVISAIRHSNPSFVPDPEGQKAFVYWKRPSNQTLEIFESDWLTVTILSLIIDSPCMTIGTLMQLLKDNNIIQLLPESNLINDCLNGLYSVSLLRAAS